MTKKRHGGARSPLDENAEASADALAFAKMKFASPPTTEASWSQFAVWMKRTYGIDMRHNSLYTWCRNRSRTDG